MTLEQPTGEMWQKIREELNENADTKDQDLAHIKEWLKKEPHLPDEFGKLQNLNLNQSSILIMIINIRSDVYCKI